MKYGSLPLDQIFSSRSSCEYQKHIFQEAVVFLNEKRKFQKHENWKAREEKRSFLAPKPELYNRIDSLRLVADQIIYHELDTV